MASGSRWGWTVGAAAAITALTARLVSGAVRLHLFLIIAILILAILTVGVFWEAPFQTTPPPQGIAAIFFQAWGYVVLPIRFVIDKLSAAHVDASPTVTIHRQREGGDTVEQTAHAAGHGDGVLVGAYGAQLLEVTTGNERPLSAAADHNDGGVRLENAVECAAELVHRRESDGVAHLGPVDGDDGNSLLDLDPHAAHCD